MTDGQEKTDVVKRKNQAIQAAFNVIVDYGRSLAEMIVAGHYDWTNSDITAKHFPVKGEGRQKVELVLVLVLLYFNKEMTSEAVLAEMDRAGYRPARIEELLALGASKPELQKEFPIVALGSVWLNPSGRCYVPCLDWYRTERDLRLAWFEDDWHGFCRFLAVRNAS